MDVKCEVCEQSVAKYKCPACAKQSCSLACVKHHKEDTGCDGIRNKTEYISVRNFTDIDLLSDYRFLEDAGRKADGATRASDSYTPKDSNSRFKLNQQCKRRDITLLSMPLNMSRRQQNNSHYKGRLETISWTVDWVFPQSDAKYTEQVMETTLLSETLSRFIDPSESDPVIRQKLKVYVHPGIKNVKVFMKVEGRKADSVRYYELDKNKTLGENLKGKMIIEYPTLYCEPCYCCDQYKILSEGEKIDKEAFAGLVKSTDDQNPSRNKRKRWRNHGGKKQRMENGEGNNEPQNRTV